MREEENLTAAGISAPSDVDVAVLFERLREELRRGPVNRGADGAAMATARSAAERFWPVTAERDLERGPKGFIKRVLRKLMRWYVEPLAAEQRLFNDSVLKLIDALSARADDTAAAGQQATRVLS